jgi:hypothetical protein
MPDCALLIAVVSSGCRDSMRSVVPAFSTFCRPSLRRYDRRCTAHAVGHGRRPNSLSRLHSGHSGTLVNAVPTTGLKVLQTWHGDAGCTASHVEVGQAVNRVDVDAAVDDGRGRDRADAAGFAGQAQGSGTAAIEHRCSRQPVLPMRRHRSQSGQASGCEEEPGGAGADPCRPGDVASWGRHPCRLQDRRPATVLPQRQRMLAMKRRASVTRLFALAAAAAPPAP